MNLAAAGLLLFSVIDDGWRTSDASDITLPVGFTVLAVLFVIPAVRKHYWSTDDRAQGTVRIEGKQL